MPAKRSKVLARHEIILTIFVTLTLVAGVVVIFSLYNYFSNAIFEQNQTKLEQTQTNNPIAPTQLKN